MDISRKERKEAIKEIIRDIHAGADLDTAKEKFKAKLGNVSATEIGQAEEELVREGLPRQEVRHLCEAHLAVMRDALGPVKLDVPPGHPIHTFREEHARILDFLAKLKETVAALQRESHPEAVSESLALLKHVAEHLMEIEKHNAREENVLFPYLEKHGISEPPAVMWAEHNDLREMKKQLLELTTEYELLGREKFLQELAGVASQIDQTLSSHIFKENNILYPMALQALSEEEWRQVRRECDVIGYCCFTPPTAQEALAAESKERAEVGPATGDRVVFPTGTLTHEELRCLLNALPVDLTFVDRDDTFRYYSETRGRIFVRTTASIGRKVQQCHPAQSLDKVNALIDDFRHGRRDAEHFWIHLGDKYVYISYYAVRSEKGEYLGTVEVTQDIAPLQHISGEKRLLSEQRE